MTLRSYPSVFNLGHAAIASLTQHPCLVEEKIDGSQVSFGMVEGVLHIRSKGAVIEPEHPPKMFGPGVEFIRSVAVDLREGWTYRGEYLAKPKHNVLPYSRFPNNHIVIFDIDTADQCFCGPIMKVAEAERVGLETVPLLYQGEVTLEVLTQLLTTESMLGGVLVEGVVVKPLHYDLFGKDAKVLMGKYVSEAFKETHKREWKVGTRKDVIALLAAELAVPVRWQKMVHRLRDEGTLTNAPKDIGELFRLVHEDVEKEELDYLKDRLWAHFGKEIKKRSTYGLAEWYKQQLMEQQFLPKEEENHTT